MEKTIFITIEGGVIQNICATEDMVDTGVVVVDYDIDGINEANLVKTFDNRMALIYDYLVESIDDGDIETFEEIKKST